MRNIKKSLSILIILSLAITMLIGCGKKEDIISKTEEEKVVANVVALKGPTGMGLVKMIDDEKSSEESEYNFTIANSPDEITPKLVSNEFQIAAIPANLASVLYNNTEGEIVTLAINTLGVLYVVENGNTINSVEDLKGKTIYSSGKGSTPEYALDYILEQNGLNKDTDVTVEYKSEHTECLSALLNDENGVAVLPQPFVTTALSKSDNLRVALDLTEEWDKINEKNGESSTLITGVIVARKDFVEKYPEKIKSFLNEYEKSVEFTNTNIEDAANLIEENDIIPAQVAVKAIPECNITFISGKDMKEKLSGYLEILYNANPKSVGGNLPGEDFYYNEK